MTTSTVKLLPKSTAEVEIDIPWEEIKSTYQRILDQVAQESEVAGFRKGKAPKKLVEKNLNKTKVYEEVIRDIIPKEYAEAVKKHNLSPVASPKIEIVKAKENQNWQIKATIALKPKINLKNYKEKIRELIKSKVKIWVPGKSKEEEAKKPSLDELVNILFSEVEIELSDLLINQETERLLADLIDQTRKLGLTVDQYLMAKGKTTEQIREEYKSQAVKTLTIEFAIAEIADKENITVTQEDFDKLLSKVEKEEDKEKLRKDSYYLAHLIRQQKTLDFLNNL